MRGQELVYTENDGDDDDTRALWREKIQRMIVLEESERKGVRQGSGPKWGGVRG